MHDQNDAMAGKSKRGEGEVACVGDFDPDANHGIRFKLFRISARI